MRARSTCRRPYKTFSNEQILFIFQLYIFCYCIKKVLLSFFVIFPRTYGKKKDLHFEFWLKLHINWYTISTAIKNAKFFLNGEAEFLNRGVVKNMAKNMRANMGENLERGPFGTFKGTILNGERLISSFAFSFWSLLLIVWIFCRLIASLNQKHLERIVSIYIFGDLLAIERCLWEGSYFAMNYVFTSLPLIPQIKWW